MLDVVIDYGIISLFVDNHFLPSAIIDQSRLDGLIKIEHIA